ncbi:MAG TPA: hypothetical protein VFJ14_13325 [Nocardioidaceae bacterium]|nr:hypothetical protein [Nocardioidaceae bacterium]
MTTTDALRRAARVSVVAAPAAVLLAASPAFADTPASWQDPAPMSPLTALLVFVGIPLALFVTIALLTLAPSLIRGDRQQRGVTSWTEPDWFGNEVSRTQHPRGEQPRGELEGGTAQSGGASARW